MIAAGDAEFTEGCFKRMLAALKGAGYAFAGFGERHDGRHVLWRHDVDLSPHRALALAKIEAEEGAIATYFVNPRANFYSLSEREVVKIVSHISGLGHQIGLHFDGDAQGAGNWTAESLEAAVAEEARLLRLAVGFKIMAVSWHNPDLGNLLDFDANVIAGLHNVYCRRIRDEYTYCSDSNGYWRFKPMTEVIAEGHDRLHLLTHPEWWTPEPMSPSDRIHRAINGRAKANRRFYDELIAAAGRANVGAAPDADSVQIAASRVNSTEA